jgi:hypothetical protein
VTETQLVLLALLVHQSRVLMSFSSLGLLYVELQLWTQPSERVEQSTGSQSGLAA